MIPRNSPVEWLPIGHRPPLPRIETAPRYTPAPPNPLGKEIDEQFDRMHEAVRRREGERIWQHVIEIAKGG